MVKVPEPLHPDVTPVNIHDPVMVLFARVPVIVSTLPLGVPDCTVNSKFPLVTPLVLPVSVKPPVSDETDVKQDVAVLNVRLLPVMVVLLLWCKEMVNENAGVPLESLSVALQVPLMLFELPLPHEAKIRDDEKIMTSATHFMTALLLVRENPFGS
jgi:hypothetical protein